MNSIKATVVFLHTVGAFCYLSARSKRYFLLSEKYLQKECFLYAYHQAVWTSSDRKDFSGTFFGSANPFQDLGLCVWRIREYLEKRSPPLDVELLYFNWVAQVCRKPSLVEDLSEFRKAFPILLRSEMSALSKFVHNEA